MGTRDDAVAPWGVEMGVEKTQVLDDDQALNVLQCPRCKSQEVHEFRMGTIRYRVSGGREVAGHTILKQSEDPIFHRCVECGYGSNTDEWDTAGWSDFATRKVQE